MYSMNKWDKRKSSKAKAAEHAIVLVGAACHGNIHSELTNQYLCCRRAQKRRRSWGEYLGDDTLYTTIGHSSSMTVADVTLP